MNTVLSNVWMVRGLAVAILAGFLAGCEREPVDEARLPSHSTPNPAMPAGESQPAKPVPPAGAGADEKPPAGNNQGTGAGVNLRVGDENDLKAIIAGHQGKVVLVDFWATWCAPCVRQFPHTVELSRHNPEELVVIAVSMDDPDDEASVREFLHKHDVKFENLINTYGVGQEGFAAFDITNGAIPHYKLYDRRGTLRHSLDDNADIDSLINALLAEDETP